MVLTRAIAALLAGAFMTLGFAPFEFLLAPIIALALVFVLIIGADSLRQALPMGYAFGLGYAGGGVHWIYVSIAQYGGGPLAASLATSTLIALFALIPMAALALGWLASRKHPKLGALLGMPLAWMLVEWLRSVLFTGATWLSVGYSQIDAPWAALAPVLGVYGVGLVSVLIAGGLAYGASRRASMRTLAPVAILIVLSIASGGLERQWSKPQGSALSVALLQGNIGQHRKWDPAEREAIFAEYAQLTAQARGESIIVWPEAALPVFFDQAQAALAALRTEAQAAGSTVVLGAPRREQNAAYNAVAVLTDPPQFYDKRHLVPFGEYVPFRQWAGGLLDFVGTPLGDFAPGDESAALMIAGQPVAVSICYEITFGALIAQSLPAATLLLNVSNDAWFGRSIAPWQHLQMARMRAREMARPVLRATNTGVSAVINASGDIQAQTAMFERTVLRADVQPRAGVTPYMRWGDWPVVGVSFAGIVLLLLTGRRPYRLFRDV